MEEGKKPVRIRIEGPPAEPLELPPDRKEKLSFFYPFLLFFTFIFLGASLYFVSLELIKYLGLGVPSW